MQLYIDLTVDKIKTENNELIYQPQVVNSEQKKNYNVTTKPHILVRDDQFEIKLGKKSALYFS